MHLRDNKFLYITIVFEQVCDCVASLCESVRLMLPVGWLVGWTTSISIEVTWRKWRKLLIIDD